MLSKVNEVYKMKVGAQTICLPCEEKVPEAERDNIQNKVKDFFARIKESETSTKLKNFFRFWILCLLLKNCVQFQIVNDLRSKLAEERPVKLDLLARLDRNVWVQLVRACEILTLDEQRV